MFLETYGGDYTKAPSNEDFRKIMMAKTYDSSADGNAIAPQFMELIISAADTWRKLDKHSKDSELTRKRKEITVALEPLVEGSAAESLDASASNNPFIDADKARTSLKDAAKAELATITGADSVELGKVIDNLSDDKFKVIDNKTITDFPNVMNTNTLPVVLALNQNDITDLLNTFNITLKSDDTINKSLKSNNKDWSGPDGGSLVGVLEQIKLGTNKGLSMSAWSNIIDGNGGSHPIGKFTNWKGDAWRYNLMHDNGYKLFANVLPSLPEGATFNNKTIGSLKDIFTEIQGLAIDSSADNQTIISLDGMKLSDARTAATKAKDSDIDVDSNFFKSIISTVSADAPSKTITDDLFNTPNKNDMAGMTLHRDKKGLYVLEDDGEKNYDFNKPLDGNVKVGINDCIIKGDKIGLAECLNAKSNFYQQALNDMGEMKPELILYMCQKIELVKKSVKLEGTNIVVKVPCPFDEWMQHLKNNPDKAKYVATLETTPAGENLQKYIKGIIDYLTKEKRILNETLTDSVYSDVKSKGKVVGKKADGNDRIIPVFVVPKKLKRKNVT
jgi:hypothetical protein